MIRRQELSDAERDLAHGCDRPSHGGQLHGLALACLVAAARYRHIETTLAPALLISDRYPASTLARNGYAALSIDGGAEQRLDYYGAIRTGETLQFLSPRLPHGRHTLRVRVTGEHDAQSGASFVSVDRAEVDVH
ncbi:hypothetical protein BJ996_007019 [Streptomyces phaeogriseichromatogenes]|nr:hypothetical protein [Streptomyces murinus]BBC91450.1 hypothetical protein SRO_0274 [Streptomyces rochei]